MKRKNESYSASFGVEIFFKKLGILNKSSPHCVTTAAGAPKPFSEETVSTNNQDPKYI